ncbi:MmpS family transport accessory protein [Mycobacteroides abscessus subsp. abscessus]|uniref:MmpS family transport accessory protein n=1 Tax=Mycobacteroides abscessus TaxID=36809 RepID=UPI00266D9681|nr:MmpS family transport accessory protein [Mycobacteroides abscessus]MDO3012723.1 MmpS family transport accessory protein [Mycobacteroides abscessus subsp. abscessus]
MTRLWIPIMVIVVVAVSVAAINRMHGIFGTHTTSGQAGTADRIVPINVKRVLYEIDGPSNASGSVSYLDEEAHPQRAEFRGLPWSLEVTTTNPSMFANLVAQGGADRLRCRILVDGTVRDDQTSNSQDAQVFCLVKAA